ncbi:MAG: hypothetical protein HGA42_12105, partial [Nostocales cyanobacterium W4_Combined_metabat2_030]|nr:hypothetical protein [Nostocales cyanobacterium W4_Combined_metabat2_030]
MNKREDIDNFWKNRYRAYGFPQIEIKKTANISLGPIAKKVRNSCESVGREGTKKMQLNNSNGPIAIGDPITVSSVVGEGAKATTSSYIVGYAMEPLTAASGTITVLVRPQYYT